VASHASSCRRAADLPRQGSRAPWRYLHDLREDRRQLLEEPIDDGVVQFDASFDITPQGDGLLKEPVQAHRPRSTPTPPTQKN
jgi:hypothetical protein